MTMQYFDVMSSYRQKGLTLVELMVGMVIALVGTIVIFQVFALSESYKRSTTGGSDAIQNGNFSLFHIERQLSWAGSGIARMPNMWGCNIQLQRNGTTVLPATTAFPSPFNIFPQQLRMTPFLIRDGGGTNHDTIMAIAGSNDSVNSPIRVDGTPGVTSVPLVNTVGVKKNDYLMIVEQASVGTDCPIAQVDIGPGPGTPNTLAANPVALNTSNSTVAGFSGFTGSAKVINLGPNPQIAFFGIGTDSTSGTPNTLLTYELVNGSLAPFNSAPIAIADNIASMQAIYGVANTPTDPVVGQWVSAANAPWDVATLMNGSATSSDLIARLRAVRIAIIARNAQPEKDIVSPATLPLFADIPSVAVNLSLTASEQKFRYKVVETVIPLRNLLIANN